MMKKFLIASVTIVALYLTVGFGTQKLGSYYFNKGDLSKAKSYYILASRILFFSNSPDNRIKIVERDQEDLEKLVNPSEIIDTDIKDDVVISEQDTTTDIEETTPIDQDPPADMSPISNSSDSFKIFNETPEMDDKHPIIVKVSDNKGNYTTGSTGNGIPFFVTWPDPKPKVKDGETIKITVEAKDPKGNEIRYKFMDNRNKTLKDWSSSNTFDWKVSKDQGGNPFIVPMIKNRDDVYRYGDSDDSTVLYYELK